MAKKIQKETESEALNNDFVNIILDYHKELFTKATGYFDEEDILRMSRSFLTGEDFTPQKPYELNAKEDFLVSLMYDYFEIHNSFISLKTSYILAKKIKANNYLPKNELLSYYYENFLSELYMFSERMKMFFNTIEKQLEKLHLNEVYKSVVILRQSFIDAFKTIKLIRNQHTHQRRYDNSMFKQLSHLQLMQNFDVIKDIPILRSYTDLAYKKNKKFFIENMKEILDEIAKGSNDYINRITPIVFDIMLKKFKQLEIKTK